MSDANDEKPASPPQPAAPNETLDRAEAELRRGHFAAARKLLKKSADSDARSDAASDRRQSLWARLSPDPMIPWLVLACLALYVAIVASTAHTVR